MCSLPFFFVFCRYETSCTAEQIPSRLRPGGEEWPVLRWYPGLEGHVGQRLLCSEPQVCRPNYWGQWWRSIPRPPSAQGEFIMCCAPFGLGWGVQMEWTECVSMVASTFKKSYSLSYYMISVLPDYILSNMNIKLNYKPFGLMFNSGLFHTSHASTMQATRSPDPCLHVDEFLDVNKLAGYMPPVCFYLVS